MSEESGEPSIGLRAPLPFPHTLSPGTPCACRQRLELIKNVAGTHVYQAGLCAHYHLAVGSVSHTTPPLPQDKRTESLAILEESEGKRSKITDVRAAIAVVAGLLQPCSLFTLPPCSQVITSIEERLASLEEETAELAEFSRLDRERRALEYVLYRRGALLLLWGACACLRRIHEYP